MGRGTLLTTPALHYSSTPLLIAPPLQHSHFLLRQQPHCAIVTILVTGSGGIGVLDRAACVCVCSRQRKPGCKISRGLDAVWQIRLSSDGELELAVGNQP